METIYDKTIFIKSPVVVANILPIVYFRMDVKITGKGVMDITTQNNDLALSSLERTEKGIENRKELLDTIDVLPDIISKYKNKIVDDTLLANIEYDLVTLFARLGVDTRGFFQLELKDNIM